MTNICLPAPTDEAARAAFGSDFNPDKTLNGAIALAAAGDLAGPALALMRAVFAWPRCRRQAAGSNDCANRRAFELHLCFACFHSYSTQQRALND